MADALPASVVLQDKSGKQHSRDSLRGKVVAFYFSAHWCPPCRNFTPLLANFYKMAKEAGQPFEIVFVSGDRSAEEMQDYFTRDHGDWLTIAYDDATARQALNRKYSVQGIPTLVVVDEKGTSVAEDARSAVHSAAQQGAGKVNNVVGVWKEKCNLKVNITGGSQAGDADAMRAARLARLG
eukprot:Hpha_TRINITY_DN13059_c0_g2::TRINITY_DN13059_c0_g2_i1::g.69024::m.69024/K17609/NXN; nucleoredoxin